MNINNNSLEGFDKVWDRVVSDSDRHHGHRPPPPKPPCQCETLRRMMDGAAQSAEVYRQLARQCRSRRDATVFGEMSRDESAMLNELQSAYYLMTGDSYRPQVKPRRSQGMLSQIREQYYRELKSAQMYEDTIRENKISNISAICKKNLAIERRHAENLERIINNVMR